MFIRDSTDGFEFDDQTIFDQQIREVFPKHGTIFVIDFQWMLLFNAKSLFAQSISERILVDFLQVSAAVVGMNGKTRFPNHIAQLIDVFPNHGLSLSFLCLFVFFVAIEFVLL